MSKQEERWYDIRHLVSLCETQLQQLNNDTAQRLLAETNLVNACNALVLVYTNLYLERLHMEIGIQGTTGVQGLSGPQGMPGSQGAIGPQGLQGIQGPQGTQGPPGVPGSQGSPGVPGTPGTTGLQGIQGVTGLSTMANVPDTTTPLGVTGTGNIQVGETVEVVSSVTTSWVRGKIYQLAPGSYDNLIFKTPDADTTKVEIRGSPDVKVRKITVNGNYLDLINLEIYDTISPKTTRAWMVDVAAGMHNLLLDRVQIHRPDRTYFGRGIYATRGLNHHITLKDCWIHDLWGPFYYGIGDSDITFDGGVYENNNSDSVEHSEGLDLNRTTNLIVKNVTMRNVAGTSYLVALHYGATNWKIFNNVFYMDEGGPFGVGHGTIADNTSSDAPSENIQIYHNTFVFLGSNGGRSGVTFWVPKNVLVRNNLFYKCTKLSMLGADHDYSATYDCPTSTEYTKAAHDVARIGNPFADAAFRLQNIAKHAGQPLADEFRVDRDGKPRANWTRGAYE